MIQQMSINESSCLAGYTLTWLFRYLCKLPIKLILPRQSLVNCHGSLYKRLWCSASVLKCYSFWLALVERLSLFSPGRLFQRRLPRNKSEFIPRWVTCFGEWWNVFPFLKLCRKKIQVAYRFKYALCNTCYDQR